MNPSPPLASRLRLGDTVHVEQVLSALGVGVVVFASTNVDDILLLSAFFSDPSFPPRQIVIGQFVGIVALILASAACALLAFVVPEGWIGLLGVAPLFLGLRGLWSLRREADADSDDRKPAGSRSRWLMVAGVTIANGGDNLGVYIPLFSSGTRLIPVYTAIFMVMTGVWCGLGYALVSNPLLGTKIRRYGRVALPFVLIALGLWILSKALVLLRSP